MKYLKIFSVFFLPALLFSSCMKDDDAARADAVSTPDYTPMKVGNYWIYERYDVDSSGAAVATGIIDSCYIEKDTLINNVSYSKMVRPLYANSTFNAGYLRDSLHYLVNNKGEILFSSQNFTDTFSQHFMMSGPDTLANVIVKMTDQNFVVNLPAGQFQTHNFVRRYLMYPVFSMAGNLRNMNARYAAGVGMVTETLPWFSIDPDYLERRLVRYHLN